MHTDSHENLIHASIIVCSLNGAKRIGACLESLSRQTYRRENFEIIVVDDGSVDQTGRIAGKYTAQVLRFETNRGIPAARNAGIAAARGQLIVFVDDDCVADKHWLEELLAVFGDQQIAAAGGKIVALSRDTLAQRYLEAMGYGNAARKTKDSQAGIIRRFLAYLSTMFWPIMFEKKPLEVLAVYTANAAYRKEALVLVGGFDERLKASEDSDVSARLLSRGQKIVYVPKAVVRHRHYEKISKVIAEPYRRARYTLNFYLKERKIPPVFPLPFLYVFLLAGSFVWLRAQFLVIMFLLPVFLYPWWIFRGLKERKPEYLIYAYIQLLAEGGLVIGLAQGLFARLLQFDKEE